MISTIPSALVGVGYCGVTAIEIERNGLNTQGPVNIALVVTSCDRMLQKFPSNAFDPYWTAWLESGRSAAMEHLGVTAPRAVAE